MLMLTVIVALLVRPYWALLGLPLVPNKSHATEPGSVFAPHTSVATRSPAAGL